MQPTAFQHRLDGLTADEFEQLQRMESDVRIYGTQVTAELAQLMHDNQVVGIGDHHGHNVSQQINARDYLQALKNGGATHLVIEAPPSCMEMLDEFNRSGNLDESKLPILSQSSHYVAMLKAAHAADLTIVAGDSEHGINTYQPDRDPTMASTIENILNQPGQNPQHPNKVVFWIGEIHLYDYHQVQAGHTTAAKILRNDHIKLATVAYQESALYSLAARAASVVSEPTIVSTVKAKNFGEYADASYRTKNICDYVILYGSAPESAELKVPSQQQLNPDPARGAVVKHIQHTLGDVEVNAPLTSDALGYGNPGSGDALDALGLAPTPTGGIEVVARREEAAAAIAEKIKTRDVARLTEDLQDPDKIEKIRDELGVPKELTDAEKTDMDRGIHEHVYGKLAAGEIAADWILKLVGL